MTDDAGLGSGVYQMVSPDSAYCWRIPSGNGILTDSDRFAQDVEELGYEVTIASWSTETEQ